MKIFSRILDVLFPPRVTQLKVRSATKQVVREKYIPQTIHHTTCLSSYHDPLIKALITENKYYGCTAASKHLALLLELWLTTQTEAVVLLPIPLSAKRESERGYNQVTIILEAVVLPKNVCIDTTLIKRNRHTSTQTSLNKEKRLINLNGAFTSTREKVLSYEHCTLVLIDDVLTTGATMKAAHATLAPHLHKTSILTCLTLAH